MTCRISGLLCNTLQVENTTLRVSQMFSSTRNLMFVENVPFQRETLKLKGVFQRYLSVNTGVSSFLFVFWLKCLYADPSTNPFLSAGLHVVIDS